MTAKGAGCEAWTFQWKHAKCLCMEANGVEKKKKEVWTGDMHKRIHDDWK